MIWARRVIAPAEWNEVQDQFENLFAKLGCPGQMMLVAASSTNPLILFASLPDAGLLHAFADSECIGHGELPSEALLLAGHNPPS
jgi:hypothetical protein